jgi:hypothetical protein
MWLHGIFITYNWAAGKERLKNADTGIRSIFRIKEMYDVSDKMKALLTKSQWAYLLTGIYAFSNSSYSQAYNTSQTYFFNTLSLIATCKTISNHKQP